jgi:hypothetical protein
VSDPHGEQQRNFGRHRAQVRSHHRRHTTLQLPVAKRQRLARTETENPGDDGVADDRGAVELVHDVVVFRFELVSFDQR